MPCDATWMPCTRHAHAMHMHVQGLASEPGGEDKLRAFYHDVRRLDRLP